MICYLPTMRKLTTEDFVVKAKKRHNGHYTYERASYSGATAKLTITCPIHGDFQQTADAHLAGKGCSQCRARKAAETRCLKNPDFLKRASEVHGETYAYFKINCRGVMQPVTITCPIHGDFQQTPHLHLAGHGCPKCGLASRAFQSMYTNNDFITKANRVHGNRYDYSECSYRGTFDLISIKCAQHGIFRQQPTSHLAGHGCPKCYRERAGDSQRHTPKSLEQRCREVHLNRYQYNVKNYRNIRSNIEIICDKHGKFTQQAKRHLAGDGCPACSSHESSGERELFAWIREICPEALSRTREVIAPLELDIYIPSSCVAIEYNGMYWHSCDPLERRQSLKDYVKWETCRDRSIDLFVVWEHAWQTQRPVIEHWLRHKLGKAPRLCGARQAELARPTPEEANQFYARYHLQGSPQSPVATVGLKYKEQWIAMATFSKSPERGIVMPEGSFYFSRLAFAGSVPGGASRVFRELVKQTGALVVHAHSDNSYADGNVKQLLGFKQTGTLPPRYKIWHYKYGVRHRIFWQKAAIHQRLAELKQEPPADIEKLTTYELHKLCGCRHVWDFGKTRWEWRAESVL